MTAQLRILLVVMIFLTIALLFSQIKKKKLQLQYTLTWLVLLVVLLCVSLFPGILDLLAEAMGIALPINMVFFLGFIFILVIIYRLTEAVSRQSDEIKKLTQKIALLEKELHDGNE